MTKQEVTSTAGVHQMRLLRRHSFIIIIIVVVVVVVVVVIDVVGHSKSFLPQKERFSSFENNMEQTDGRTDTTSYRDA